MSNAQFKAKSSQPTSSRVQTRVNTATSAAQVDLQRMLDDPHSAGPGDMLRLQQAAGNQAALQWLQAGKPSQEPVRADGSLNAHVAGAIHGAQGRGQSLSPVLRQEMERGLGSDFGQVRIHTDEQADQLNQQLSARAFTVGKDVFFRQGAFAPGTTRGIQILRHELTHVVQQGGRSAGRLRLGPANDVHEQEAEHLSHAAPQPAGSRPGAAAAGTVQRFLWPWQKYRRKKLSGSANAVYKVEHRGGETGFFKPNDAEDPGMGARSVLSSNVDQTLGLGALARETYRNYGSQQGSESGMVPGRTVTSNLFEQRISKKQYDEGVNGIEGMPGDPGRYQFRKGRFGRKKYFKMSGTEFNTHDYTQAATQRGLSNIQLQDAITGQMDRHGGNIRIDPVTHEARGYDNDMILIKRNRALSRDKSLHKPTDGSQFTPELRAKREAARREAFNTVNYRGDKTTGLPSHIDRATAQRMAGLKSRAFIESVRNSDPDNYARLERMHPGIMEEMRNRYAVTRRYAKAGLAGAAGGPTIVDNWDMNTYNAQVGERRDVEMYHQSYLQRAVQQYNDIHAAGGAIEGGGVVNRLDRLAAGALPAPPPAPAPAPALAPAPAPEPALAAPPAPAPEAALPPAAPPAPAPAAVTGARVRNLARIFDPTLPAI
ncbi:MAG: DUF4157 domain-containing protein [Anaerolineaceae bacterium]|nr:DUF4157 domain-containing protein [Anaerolineaceae bacterium]